MRDARLKVCKECSTYNEKSGKCDSSKGGCGCFMKIKAGVTGATCPKGEWDKQGV
jgi:hypothetical protein